MKPICHSRAGSSLRPISALTWYDYPWLKYGPCPQGTSELVSILKVGAERGRWRNISTQFLTRHSVISQSGHRFYFSTCNFQLLDSIITRSISDDLPFLWPPLWDSCIAEHKQKTLPKMHYYLEVMIGFYTAKTLMVLYISYHSTFFLPSHVDSPEGTQN